ncbi:phospholipase A1 member A-like [Planococcus citri]|uniref:phospholipase A1 member A-like n=1 Tax=Planococcus citri TaxID=170843 RepID=UPI0031F9A78E
MRLKLVIFSTFACLLIIGISDGYQYGPVIDRIIVYFSQFNYFIKSHITEVEIKSTQALGSSYPNVPETPLSSKDVKFFLYTRKNPDIHKTLFENSSKKEIRESGFDPHHETVIFCHGYNTSYTKYASNFTSNLLPRTDINIVIIEWDLYSSYNVIYVEFDTLFRLGKIIAGFVQSLIDAGADRKMIHLIGYSDGGGAVTLAAKQIRPTVGRITAFDPVGDYFNYFLSPPNQILSADDADYVQVIHCTVYHQALSPQLKGDITFYMNGALIQPQCAKFTNISNVALCSHLLCGPYLVESLMKKSTLVGIKCAGFLSNSPKDYDFSDKVTLTYDVPTKFKGSYCVHTDHPPAPDVEEA